MAARTSRRSRAVSEPAIDDEIAESGVMGRLVDRVMDNPAMSGGLLVMALTVAAVVSNAVFLQKARHPEPWFMTRPAAAHVEAPPPSVGVPDPRPRAEMLALPEPAGVPTPTPAPALPAAVPERVVITELQRKLAEQGLYDGKVDGISGSRTRAAIVAYQEAQGLPVTGEPSLAVLDHINTASIATPLPAAPPSEASVPAETVAYVPEPAGEAATAAPVPPPAASEDPLADEIAIAARNRYLAVQQALNRLGYGPVAEDGNAGEGVENAIRRFELDNGLPITGAPDEQVLDRLVAIGAMQPI